MAQNSDSESESDLEEAVAMSLWNVSFRKDKVRNHVKKIKYMYYLSS